ncbi:ATP-binding protein [Nonomuraea diastatica]|uniref:Helix-turn-helix transcriptional regulator n=1 Tax=Nonomuraea diastatica TaxID=1848329 RepID=A0A4R4WIZ2_9ACTN|nr:helix-turn-helix transcriptional regulator [Nonomuraea diastatica]TDD13590.1 helix-turn-helix transcriptional regulator [Nonomuraea diastatica]
MLHGREEELQALSGLVSDTRRGRGRALVVQGEAGIGKTALLRWAAAEAGSAMRVLGCSGVQAELPLAFGGLHQLLSPLLDLLPELPEQQAAALRSALGLSPAPTADLPVRIAALSLLRRAADETPLLVVVDDLQWLDRASAGVVLFAARRLDRLPIGLLAALREPEGAGDAGDLIGKAPAAPDTRDFPRIALHGLAEDAASALLDEQGWGTPGPTRRAIVSAVGGNPLALEEVVRLGDPPEVAERIVLTGTAPVGRRLRAVFAERTRGLPEQVRTLLLVAAAEDSGRTDIVLGAAGRLGADARALDAAERAGHLDLPGPRLRFRHPLVRAAVYADASTQSRARVHRALADELALSPEPAQGERAVWHRALAATGPDDRLAEMLEAGAAEVKRRGGLAAAAAVLHRAAQMSTAPQQHTRRLTAAADAAWKSGSPQLARPLLREALVRPADDVTRLELLRLQGMMELWDGDQEAAVARLLHVAELLTDRHTERAVDLTFMAVDGALRADRMDEALRAAAQIEAAGARDPGYARYGRWLAESLADRPRHGLSPWQLFDAAPKSLARDEAIRWVWAAALGTFGAPPRQVRAFTLEACAHLDATGMLAVYVLLLSWLAELEYRLGMWQECAAHAQEGLRAARDVGQPVLEADLLALLALLCAGRGQEDECREHAERALALAVTQGNRSAAATAQWALGRLALNADDYEEACERLGSLGRPGSPFAHRRLARRAALDGVEAQVRAGRREGAEQAAREFEQWSEQSTLTWPQLHRHALRALLAEGDAADKHFREALAAPGAADEPFIQARTAMLYGEWLRRTRHEGEARRQLRHAVEVLEGLGAEQEAERARRQLRAAGGATRRRRGDPTARLTVQELQVARLAAAGLSNREIGARLAVSPRTVGYHLYKIFPKLGISSRSQLRDADL